jgi:hypothetical protein
MQSERWTNSNHCLLVTCGIVATCPITVLGHTCLCHLMPFLLSVLYTFIVLSMAVLTVVLNVTSHYLMSQHPIVLITAVNLFTSLLTCPTTPPATSHLLGQNHVSLSTCASGT